MEPREGREEEERGSEGGRRGEAHNAMGHGGWTDSICSQLSVALVMDGELGRDTERAGRRETGETAGGEKKIEEERRGKSWAREQERKSQLLESFLSLF